MARFRLPAESRDPWSITWLVRLEPQIRRGNVLRLLHREEEEALSDLLIAKTHAAIAKTHATAGDPAEELERRALSEFVAHRFAVPLRANARGGPLYGRALTWLSVATIAAGLASSAIAASSENPPTTLLAVLGLAVGIFTAVNQLWRPAQRSVARYQAAYALRREAWDFINDRGRYERVPPDKRLGTFVDEVNRAQRAVEAIDEEVAQSAPSAMQ